MNRDETFKNLFLQLVEDHYLTSLLLISWRAGTGSLRGNNRKLTAQSHAQGQLLILG